MINIAIDGPAGAGKSTLAKLLAKKFGYIYVDTGALYRSVALFAARNSVEAKDYLKVKQLLPQIHLDIRYIKGAQRVYLNDEDVSNAIRTPEISMAASAVSAISEVRSFLLNLQKDIAARNDVVMDGRDIGTVVLPNADIKIFLTASPEDRAGRRYRELLQKKNAVNYDDVLADVLQRDKQDAERAIAPLKPADDAIIVDTTGFELEQSLQKLILIVKERLK